MQPPGAGSVVVGGPVVLVLLVELLVVEVLLTDDVLVVDVLVELVVVLAAAHSAPAASVALHVVTCAAVLDPGPWKERVHTGCTAPADTAMPM